MRMIESLLQRTLDPLRLQKTFYPLGFPLFLSTNSEAVFQAADAEWAVWAPGFDKPPVSLWIEVSKANGALPASTQFHGHHHLFAYVADARNFGICDTRARMGTAWITASAAEDTAYLRYYFLEAMAYQLIASLYLTPIHGACVVRNERGVILCGDSGAGKSSLAYACARRGWTYVTDDATYLIRCGKREVVGNAHQIRLRPEASGIFPELAGHAVTVRGKGKPSIEIRTRAVASITATPRAGVHRLVFLRRSAGGPARLKSLDKAEARAWGERVLYWWNPKVAAEQQANLLGLLAASRVEALEYSDLGAAVDALER